MTRLREWPASLAIVVVVLAAICVTLVGLWQTPKYEASAQVRMDQRSWQGDQQANFAGGGEEFQTIILTTIYAIDSRPVAEEAIQRLGLEASLSPAELRDDLTIEQVEDTSFMALTYEGTDPVRARQIVNTFSKVSSEFIPEIRFGQTGIRLTATVVDKAAVPHTAASPHPFRNGLLTLVAGLALVGLWAFVSSQLR
jgi:capsular polysaccharide biosynthesis protein